MLYGQQYTFLIFRTDLSVNNFSYPKILCLSVTINFKSSLRDADITSDDIASFGISVQRGTFILWDKESEKPLHNFIVWQV